ncbi:MAG: pentapeptide repeat-containing protein [Acidimicrobiales bacterium]
MAAVLVAAVAVGVAVTRPGDGSGSYPGGPAAKGPAPKRNAAGAEDATTAARGAFIDRIEASAALARAFPDRPAAPPQPLDTPRDLTVRICSLPHEPVAGKTPPKDVTLGPEQMAFSYEGFADWNVFVAPGGFRPYGCDPPDRGNEVTTQALRDQARSVGPLHVKVGPHLVLRCEKRATKEVRWIGTDGMVADDACTGFDTWEVMDVVDALARYHACQHCDFSGMDLSDLILGQKQYETATEQDGFQIGWSNFDGATLRNVDFGNALLHDLSFRGATLVDTNFGGAWLDVGDFSPDDAGKPARLLRVKLPAIVQDTRFDRAVLHDVVQDEGTTFGHPNGTYGCSSLRETTLRRLDGVDLASWSLDLDHTLDTPRKIAPDLPDIFPRDCSAPLRGAVIDGDHLPSASNGATPFDDVALWFTPAQAAAAKADLSGAHLARVVLLGARPDLSGSKLDRADLSGTDLSTVRFFHIATSQDLEARTTFVGANLTGTNLSGAVLVKADLTDADLTRANLTRADLTGATLERAHAGQYAQGKATNVALFTKALLTGTDFSSAKLWGSSFEGAHMFPLVGVPTRFDSAELDQAKFGRSLGASVSFLKGHLSGASFDDAVCVNCSFKEADLSAANMVRTVLVGTNFTNTNQWQDVNLTDARVSDVAGTWHFALGEDEGGISPKYGETRLPDDTTMAHVTACPDGDGPSAASGCGGREVADADPAQVPCRSAGAFRCPATIERWPSGSAPTHPTGVVRRPGAPERMIVGTNASGAAVATVVASSTPHLVTLPGVGEPTAVATMHDGSYLVADGAKHRIWRLTVAASKGSVTIAPFAGNGQAGSAGDGGPALEAQLTSPAGVWVDREDVVWVASGGGVRRIGRDGVITTAASGMNLPTAITGDRDGNVYVVDRGARKVLRIDPSGQVSVYAGTGKVSDPASCGEGCNAPTLSFEPTGIAVVDVTRDEAGAGTSPTTVVISDYGAHLVRQVAPDGSVVADLVGTGDAGDDGDGTASSPALASDATIGGPGALGAEPDGSAIYVVDEQSHRVRRVVLA